MLKDNFAEFARAHVDVVEVLERERNLAYWKAALSGKESDYEELTRRQMKIDRIYSSRKDFEFIDRVREEGAVEDPMSSRIADLLYLRYLGNQADENLLGEITALSSRVENRFNVFRPAVEGRKLTLNQIRDILRTEEDSGKRKKVWESSKEAGTIVAEDLIRLVELRNSAAENAGFDNYYSMSLYLSEQDEESLLKLFDRLDSLTRKPYERYKQGLDAGLTERFGLREEDLRPWHYNDPFFQEPPPPAGLNLDELYTDADVVQVAERFYGSIGLEASDILQQSDLYEREGKSPHAFCIDIDRAGDIRILANIKNDSKWMGTVLHELGHGVYDKNIDRSLPYLLRKYPHYCLTEASAMFFGALAKDPDWIGRALELEGEKYQKFFSALEEFRKIELLVFARWCQVMFRFERELYRNAHRDLNSLWWSLVEEYQLVSPPQGSNNHEWAAKIHLVMSPAYYHNYMLGELIAAQFRHLIKERGYTGGGIYGSQPVGEYFSKEVYAPGNILPWNKHIERATGKPLRADHFAEYFI